MSVAPLPLAVRIDRLSIPEPNSGCHLWLGVVSAGYGLIEVPGGTREARRCRGAHVVAYELKFGPIPAGLQVDHKCRTTICVNPSHLEAVTSRVNHQRGNSAASRNMRKTMCHRGHLLDGTNLYVTPDGRRQCRACAKLRGGPTCQ